MLINNTAAPRKKLLLNLSAFCTAVERNLPQCYGNIPVLEPPNDLCTRSQLSNSQIHAFTAHPVSTQEHIFGAVKPPYKGKGRAIPLQAWTGPEGSRRLRLPDFLTTAHESDKVVSPTNRPPLPPRKYFWYSFLLETESTLGP